MAPVTNVQNSRRKIRWVIAHFPLELFVRTAKVFADELEKLCPNQFSVEIHTIGSYLGKYRDLYTEEQLRTLKQTTPQIPGLEEPFNTVNKDNVKAVNSFPDINEMWSVLFDALKEGKFEMSQTQVSIVGSHLHKNFHAIDLPYLWNSHDHVSTALDGEIGDRLCAEIGDATGVRGLGFTYSGGYRIIGSTDGITSLNDLNNKKFVTATATSNMLFGKAGINHLPRYQSSAQDVADMAEAGGAIETTYLRFGGKNVLKTEHSVFMTSILACDSFLSSLTTEQQEAFKIAAKRVAKIERIWSVEDAKKYEDEAVSRGVTTVEASDEDKQRLKDAAQKVYLKENLERVGINSTLVNDIIEIGKTL